MSTIQVFMKLCGSIDAVKPDLYTKVMVPRVDRENKQRNELLEPEYADIF